MAGYLETVLIQEQRQAENLTTFEVYPFPPRLREVFYPLDFRGDPMAPELLVMHSRSHMFNMPRCFHGRDSKLVFGRNGKAFLICGEEGCCPCGFFIDVRALLYTGLKVQCVRYSLRLGPSPSSGGASTPASLPSLASSSPSEDQRMPDIFDGPRSGSRGVLQRVESGFAGAGEEHTYAPVPRTLFHVPGVRGELSSLSPHESMQQTTVGSMSVIRPYNGSFYWADDDACMKGREDADAVTFFDGLRCSPNNLTLGPSDWSSGRVVASEALRCSRLPLVVPPPRCKGELEDLCDEDTFPLLARPDGMCSLTSCLDPVTRDFSNELFLSQIIKDSIDNEIKY